MTTASIPVAVAPRLRLLVGLVDLHDAGLDEAAEHGVARRLAPVEVERPKQRPDPLVVPVDHERRPGLDPALAAEVRRVLLDDAPAHLEQELLDGQRVLVRGSAARVVVLGVGVLRGCCAARSSRLGPSRPRRLEAAVDDDPLEDLELGVGRDPEQLAVRVGERVGAHWLSTRPCRSALATAALATFVSTSRSASSLDDPALGRSARAARAATCRRRTTPGRRPGSPGRSRRTSPRPAAGSRGRAGPSA